MIKLWLKVVVCVGVALGGMAGSALAENFVLDGGFESGGLSKWWSQGNVAVQTNPPGQQTEGTHSAIFNSDGSSPSGIISQTVTIPSGGAPCWLEFSYGTFAPVSSQAIRYYISCNNQTLATGLIYATASPLRYGQVFQPTSTSVTITFVDASYSASAASGVLDAVLVQRLPGFSLPGKYAGSELRTIAFADQNISSSETHKVTARISPNGEISILEQPGSLSLSHIILSSGVVVVLGTDGEFTMVQGTLKGSTLKYSYQTTGTQPSSNRPLTYTHSFNLHKVGP